MSLHPKAYSLSFGGEGQGEEEHPRQKDTPLTLSLSPPAGREDPRRALRLGIRLASAMSLHPKAYSLSSGGEGQGEEERPRQ